MLICKGLFGSPGTYKAECSGITAFAGEGGQGGMFGRVAVVRCAWYSAMFGNPLKSKRISSETCKVPELYHLS